MNFLKLLLLTPFILNASLSAEASKEKMIHEIDGIKYNISINYAPLEWKKEHLKWDLDESINKTVDLIKKENKISAGTYHEALKKFFASMQDYHVSPTFFTRDVSFFPLLLQEAEGKIFIVKKGFKNILNEDRAYIDDESLAKWKQQANMNSFFHEINVGSEVLSINDIPIKDYINQIIEEELGGNQTPTAFSLAISMVFKKIGMLGQNTENGSFTITLIDQNNKIQRYNFPWFHISEPLLKREFIVESNKDSLSGKTNVSLSKKIKRKHRKDYSVLLAKNYVKAYLNHDSSEEIKAKCNVTKGFLPPLGEVTWKFKGKSSLYAYIYTLKNGNKIGYIFLPTFYYEEDEEEKIIQDIYTVMLKFQKSVNGLVFDITNNPGGYADFMNEVISMISNKKVIPLLEKEIINPSIIYEALEDKRELEKELPLVKDIDEKKEIHELLNYYSTLIDSFEQNKTITEPLYSYGEEYIEPDMDIMFNKPILVLINELDFSCGDYFPAMIQDNKIGYLFGQKTAGAGGSVFSYESPSQFGLKGYTLTGSLGFRKDGTLLENIGVTPDFPYKITIKDLQKNYCDYVNAVNATMSALIKNHKKRKN